MNSDLTLPGTVVFLAAGLAAYSDIRSFRIPNLLTYPLLISGCVYHAAVGGLPAFFASLAGATFGFAAFFFVYLLGGMGGGDIKLLAAVGAWLGVFATAIVVLVAALISCFYSLWFLNRNVGWARSCSALTTPFKKAYDFGEASVLGAAGAVHRGGPW